jgi:hypothetical protein
MYVIQINARQKMQIMSRQLLKLKCWDCVRALRAHTEMLHSKMTGCKGINKVVSILLDLASVHLLATLTIIVLLIEKFSTQRVLQTHDFCCCCTTSWLQQPTSTLVRTILNANVMLSTYAKRVTKSSWSLQLDVSEVQETSYCVQKKLIAI